MTDTPLRHARYPLFDEARSSVEQFDRTDMSEPPVLHRAIDRVVSAATVDPADNPTLGGLHEKNTVELLSYPLARILVSVIDDDALLDTYARAETTAALHRIRNDDNLSIPDACTEFDLDVREFDIEDLFAHTALFAGWEDMELETRRRRMEAVWNMMVEDDQMETLSQSDVDYERQEFVTQPLRRDALDKHVSTTFYAIPVAQYLAHAPLGEDDKWALVNRSLVADGEVVIHEDELDTILDGAIHARITDNYPVPVPQTLVNRYEETVDELLRQLPDDATDVVEVETFPLVDSDTRPRPFAVGTEDYDRYSTVGKAEDELDITDIRDHYHKAEAVYNELGTLDNLHTSWLSSHSAWYVFDELESEDENPEAWQEGFRDYSRPSILPDDFDASEAGRDVYTTNTYAPQEAFASRYYTIEDGERVWMDEALGRDEVTRLPVYDELDAYALIVDIDLEDDWKARPLPDDHRDVVETRLEAWVSLFANIIGADRDDIFVVDSGGGAYVMTPPAVTRPIAEEFADDAEGENEDEGEDDDEADVDEKSDLHHIHNAIQTRMRRLTDAFDEVITGADNAPTELFSADPVQNKNRQWKTLMSLHASMNAVVQPIDSTEIDYDVLTLEELTDDDYETAQEWAAEFTDPSYDDEQYVDALVKALFASDVFEAIDSQYETYGSKDDDWREILEEFIESRNHDAAARQKAFEKFNAEGERSDDVGVTTDKYEIDAALANVDLEKYLKRNHVQQWDTDNRSDGTISFSPSSWRNPSKDANSCFYSPGGGTTTSPVFVDRKEGWTAGIVDLVAYEDNITSHPSETPTGKDWWEAVDLLRKNGEDIPVHVPEIDDPTNDYDRLPESSIVDAARALGLAEDGDIEMVDGEYGEYEKVTNGQVFSETIKTLEEMGISTGKNDWDSDDE